jgi:hypothetical protein
MKKSLLFFVLIFLAITFHGCQKDESLDPRAQLNPGLYARLDITNKGFKEYDRDNSYFGGLLTSPSGKIVKYNLYVKRRDPFRFASEFALVKTVTSFPFDLKIYLADIAAALNMPVSSLIFGDEYYFYAEAFDAEGNRTDYYSLSSTVRTSPAMKQGFRFRTTIFLDANEYATEYDYYVNP